MIDSAGPSGSVWITAALAGGRVDRKGLLIFKKGNFIAWMNHVALANERFRRSAWTQFSVSYLRSRLGGKCSLVQFNILHPGHRISGPFRAFVEESPECRDVTF